MKTWIVVGTLVAAAWLLGQTAPHAPPDLLNDRTNASLLGSLIFALPIIGLVLALRSFGRWHRGFHDKVRNKGLW